MTFKGFTTKRSAIMRWNKTEHMESLLIWAMVHLALVEALLLYIACHPVEMGLLGNLGGIVVFILIMNSVILGAITKLVFTRIF